jgi:hypothetical protein
MLKLAGVWEKTSASGNRYFVGRMGAAKLVILENRDRAGDGEPTHFVFLTEPAGTVPRQPPKRAPVRRHSVYRQRPDDPGAPPPSDGVDDLYREIPP